MIKVAVTGNIGSGKSEFINFISKLGFYYISSDVILSNLYNDFKYIVKYCFSQKRKQLGTSLKKLGFRNPKKTFSNLDFFIEARPEELEIKDWIDITKCYQNKDF